MPIDWDTHSSTLTVENLNDAQVAVTGGKKLPAQWADPRSFKDAGHTDSRTLDNHERDAGESDGT